MIETKDIIRFTTAGSVDDGKSTLIGRLLYDCHQIPQDQIDLVRRISERKGSTEIDLSLFTDGFIAGRTRYHRIAVGASINFSGL